MLILCIASSFTLDLLTTTTTIMFLYRTRTGLSEHDGLFNAVWRVMWVSAAPPLVLMTIVLVNNYFITAGPGSLTMLSTDMLAKVSTLSLMISLLGQVYIRRKFDRSRPSQLANVDASRGTMGVISEPVFARAMTINFEKDQSSVSNEVQISAAQLSLDSLASDYGKNGLEASIVKSGEVENSHAIRLVRFPLNDVSPHQSS
ncbi:unnamed protein product [Rhizoctonia solani]|uniref:Transmembrane protein n=1 Tax=Rhizoctonia solani TaxID=456999 RepID=A0A8H3BIN8_9AGAM|nr:unnamed protein product [Rhizoctonia solani]